MTKTSTPVLVSLVLALGASGACLAQTPPAQPAAADTPMEQRAERIRVEDAGSRIDELRVGGQTRSITVQPKGNMPQYDILPSSANRAPSTGERNSASASGGTRVWKILGF